MVSTSNDMHMIVIIEKTGTYHVFHHDTRYFLTKVTRLTQS